MLAETNRAPFDLPEAEGEIVAGYNLEYASIPFALFFLGEYCNIIVMSSIFSLLFLGGWFIVFYFYTNTLVFTIKIVLLCYLFILVRANFPRYRFDQLIFIAWKIFIPVSLSYIIFISGLLVDIPKYNIDLMRTEFYEMAYLNQLTL